MEKELIDIDPKPEPVSQMHRCVFQLCSDPYQYFSLQNDAVGYVDVIIELNVCHYTYHCAQFFCC